jgi:hypothetical protein
MTSFVGNGLGTLLGQILGFFVVHILTTSCQVV